MVAVLLDRWTQSSLWQQTKKSFRPNYSTQLFFWTIFSCGILLLGLGIFFIIEYANIFYIAIDYTDCSSVHPSTLLKSMNTNDRNYKIDTDEPFANDLSSASEKHSTSTVNDQCPVCTFQLTLPKTDLFLYYKLTNYYQSGVKYVKSISKSQLQGFPLSPDQISSCSPLIESNDKPFYPCGLVADSRFNDSITLFQDLTTSFGVPTSNISVPTNTSKLVFDTNLIAWPSDVEVCFQPTLYSTGNAIPPPSWSNVNLLWPSTANIVSTDENLMNWMRVSAFSTFLKLYARITWKEQPIFFSSDSSHSASAQSLFHGRSQIAEINPTSLDSEIKSTDISSSSMIENITLSIADCFPIGNAFGGTKSIVISSASIVTGSKQLALPVIFLISGSILLLIGIIILLCRKSLLKSYLDQEKYNLIEKKMISILLENRHY